MEESAIVREWTAKALERGRQEGLEVSRQKLRAALLRLWRSRFSDPVPPEVLAAVQAQTDVDELSRWLDAGLSAATEEEARRAIIG